MVSRLIRNVTRGGPAEYIRQMLTIGDNKFGTLVGEDKYGNKYYESNEEIWARKRWVIYPKSSSGNASSIPAEWHSWLHGTIENPLKKEDIPDYPWLPTTFSENFTGTEKAYKSYSTTPQKISAWNGTGKSREG